LTDEGGFLFPKIRKPTIAESYEFKHTSLLFPILCGCVKTRRVWYGLD
jgi:hypothetical protein